MRTFYKIMQQLHLQTKLIAIKRIDLPYLYLAQDYGYTEQEIEHGARLFLKAKGLINPLILKRTNNVYYGIVYEEETPDGRYEVVHGFLEYYCVVRAREINPAQECVQAIIIDSKIEATVREQIELFRVRPQSYQIV